ncbi:histidine-rich glycoprotein-like [Penaeus monodon]|uniref:histidine-rich glycoprotein-like n=1 Tax=Penaeus monodon TaxID=6687 RepID=UPI0018A74D2A|nr:histidine-rich glycoprotein-like [Penaeus monodon]
MKYLVFVVLVAAACASEVEKREAEPSRGYSNGYGLHHRTYYHPYHKRSAEAEAEAEPTYGSSNYYRPHPYIPPVYRHHKRSADPVAEAEASYGYRSYHPVHYHSYQYTPYTHSHYKRSAEPEADPDFLYGHHHPSHSGVHYGYGYRAHHH